MAKAREIGRCAAISVTVCRTRDIENWGENGGNAVGAGGRRGKKPCAALATSKIGAKTAETRSARVVEGGKNHGKS
jgi:hypothetical protein